MRDSSVLTSVKLECSRPRKNKAASSIARLALGLRVNQHRKRDPTPNEFL